MSQEISVILSLQTAQALSKLNGFLGEAAHGLRELAAEAVALYASFEGLRKLGEAVKEAINLEEAVGRLSEKTGLSIPVIASFREQADALGVKFDQLTTSLGKFAQNIFDASTKGGTLGDTFKRMDVALVNLDGTLRSTDAILADTAKWFQTHANGAEKARVATELFGRSGRELIPVLNEGAAGIEKMKATGGPITDESVAQATYFNVKMRELHDAMELLWVQVANKLLPALIQLVEKMNAVAKSADFNSSTVATFVGILKGLVTVVVVVALAVYELGEAIGVATEVFIANFNVALATMKQALKDIQKVIKDTIELLSDLVKAAIASQQATLQAMTGHLPTAIKLWKDSYKEIKADLDAIAKDTLKTVTDAGDGANKIIAHNSEMTKYYVDDVKSQWTRLTNFLTGMWSGAPAKVPFKESGGEAKGEFVPGPTDDAIKRLNQWNAIANDLYKQQIKLIESDPFTDQVEKAKLLTPIMNEQRAALLAQIEAVKEERNAATGDDQKIATTKELVKLQGELNDLDQKSTRTSSLTSFVSQFKLVGVQLRDSWGSWAMQTASAFKAVFNSAISSISQGISGLILGTKTWGQALAMIGNTILTTIVQAIVEMGVKWVLTHVLMGGALAAFHALSVALGWSSAAQVVAQETTKAPVLATNATTASISSYGGAAIAGIALLVAALGIGIAAASGAFRESGGPVIAGRPYIVGEKRPELFVPSQSGYIMPNVPSPASGGAFAASSGAVHNNMNVMVHFPDSAAAANKHARENPEFHHIIVDIAQRNAHLIGVRS